MFHASSAHSYGSRWPFGTSAHRFSAVTDAKGTRDITFEGHSTNNMYRAGYRDGMIKVGDKITVYVAPLRDGSDGGYVTAASTADGRRFGPQSRAEQEAEREKAEGRK